MCDGFGKMWKHKSEYKNVSQAICPTQEKDF